MYNRVIGLGGGAAVQSAVMNCTKSLVRTFILLSLAQAATFEIVSTTSYSLLTVHTTKKQIVKID